MPVVAVAALAIGAVSAVASYQQGKKAAAAQEAATESQARAASVEAAKARISQVREARLREARIRAQAGATGIGQASSGVAGSISSIGSQTGANIGAINVQQSFAEQAGASLQQAAKAQLKQAGWQAIGSTAGTVFTQQDGYKGIADWLKGTKTP